MFNIMSKNWSFFALKTGCFSVPRNIQTASLKDNIKKFYVLRQFYCAKAKRQQQQQHTTE
ncbi:hypothetical protein ABE61_19535 [Lysinibacillus sphaericus]|nr:hypothetical protein [Lysinibacillus sphaericus]MBG9479170.1 hypothetical protein [Lysinibacillus sphaericus]MBG9591533.1 hypothetical protein [Lysinibacillus sphaericus]